MSTIKKESYLVFLPTNNLKLSVGTLCFQNNNRGGKQKLMRVIHEELNNGRILGTCMRSLTGRKFTPSRLIPVLPYIVEYKAEIKPGDDFLFFGSYGIEKHTMLDDAGYGLRTTTRIDGGNLIVAWSKSVKIIVPPNQIGWVRHMSKNSSFISKFEEVPVKYLQRIINVKKNQIWVDCSEDQMLEKINGKVVLTLT